MTMRAASFKELTSQGRDLEGILNDMLFIDQLCMPNIPSSLVGTTTQWRPIYADFPETWRAIVTPKNIVVAYWHFASVGEITFRNLCRGELLDAGLNRGAVEDIHAPGRHFMYLDSFSIHPQYVGQCSFWTMLTSWMEALRALALNGVFFRSLIVHAVTDAALRLCHHMHMNPHGPHPIGIGHIYSLDLLPPPNEQWTQRFSELHRLYVAESELSNLLPGVRR